MSSRVKDCFFCNHKSEQIVIILLTIYILNKSAFIFFINYYFKKHIGKYIFNQKITKDDLFWKRYFRIAKKIPLSIQNSFGEFIITTTKVSEKPLKLYVRPHSSDIKVFAQVFSSNEYEPLINMIKNASLNGSIKYIMDAGANVGYTSVNLNTAFPFAEFICIEPDDGNALQLQKNLKLNHVHNFHVIKAGLWSKNGWLSIKKDRYNGEEWGLYVVESEIESGLKALTLQSILQEYSWPHIDILKIDIEGGEYKLFKDEEAIRLILRKTKYLAIEIHDGLGDRQEIFSVLLSEGFELFESGELTIATNRNFAINYNLC